MGAFVDVATAGSAALTLGGYVNVHPSTNNSSQARGVFSYLGYSVPSGVTQSGQTSGFYVQNMRNLSTTGDNGTVSDLRGATIQWGNYPSDVTASPKTTTATGIYMAPQCNNTAGNGKITTMYDIDLRAPGAEDSITTHWSLYQRSTLAKNYYGAANNLFGTTTSRGPKVEINGTLLSTDTLRVGDWTTYSYIKAGDAAWTSSSDSSLKKNISALSPNLSLFSSVKPRTFQFKKELFLSPFNAKSLPDTIPQKAKDSIRTAFYTKNLADAEAMSRIPHTGFLAQEFNKVLGKDSKEINYSEVIAVMWMKIQELEARIAKLEGKK